MGLDEGRRLFLGEVSDDDEDRLIGQIFPGVKLLNVRDRDFAQGLFRAMGGPAIGVAMKDELMKSFHRHISWIVIIAHDLAEDLCADPFDFLFVKGGMLQHIGQKRKAQVRIFLEHAGRGGGEIFRRMGLDGSSDKIDLLGELTSRAGHSAFVQ